MTPSQPPRRPRLRRRSLLGMSVVTAAAVTGLARPASAEAAPASAPAPEAAPKAECLADLLGSE